MSTEISTDPTRFVRVAAAGSLGMALRLDGTVAAWGVFGGDVGSIAGPDGRAFVPRGVVDVKYIAASESHCLAVKNDGSVVAWGVDERGRLDVPKSLPGVTAVAAGAGHNLALTRAGTVVAWGDNSSGGCDVPSGLSDVVSVAIVGVYGHSLAIRRDGSSVAWGGWGEPLKGIGELTDLRAIGDGIALRRDGAVIQSDGNPVSALRLGSGDVWDVEDLPGVADIAGPVLLLANGTLAYRADVDLADKRVAPRDLAGIAAIAAGRAFAVALKIDGTLVAWGDNAGGQLDLPSAEGDDVKSVREARTYSAAHRESGRPRRFTAVAAGWEHSIALRDDGTVAAWGSNGRGQLDVPVDLAGVVQIAAGAKHSIALLNDGTVVTWGRTVGGPVDQPAGLRDVISVAAGAHKNLALTKDGTLFMWEQSFSKTDDLPSDWVGVKDAAIATQPIALRSDGRVLVQERSLGLKPAPAGLNEVVSVAAGSSVGYALQGDGRVVQWGERFDPFAEFAFANGGAVRFTDPSGVVAIAAGWRHILALKNDGTVTAWGDNGNGQATVPPGLSQVVAVAAGEAHSLALTSDGHIVSWGKNRDGQLNAPSLDSDTTDSNESRVTLALVFRATRNVTGTRTWKFRFGEGDGAGSGSWITGYRTGDIVFEESPTFAEIGDGYYSALTFSVMEQQFPSFKWEGDVSRNPNDSGDWEFPIVVRAKVSIRQQDLTTFAAAQIS